MTRTDAEQFAREWVHHWTTRDVERIVSHFAEDARFVSPIAAQRTGQAEVVGRDALRAYWSVVHTFTTFEFGLERILWDQQQQELAIIYVRHIDGRRDRAMELLCFDGSGLVAKGEAMYGALIES